MPAVLVHGVPETHEVWAPLTARLHRDDVVALALPGFGRPRPEGFDATKEEYVGWLIDELEALAADGPIDLVGHDWGGGLTVRLVSIRPDLVRSWVTDAAGMASADFEWHDVAKIWQTPDAGEQLFEGQLAAPPDQRGAIYERLGVPKDLATQMGSWADPTMADSILRLYRSAVAVGQEWAPDFVDVPAAGLVLVASEDPFLSDAGAKRSAARAGARIAELEGVGHWWMLQDPERGALVLEEFWAQLG